MSGQEVWKDILGFEGYYQISDTGLVRSLDRDVRVEGDGRRTHLKGRKGKLLSPLTSGNGYLFVTLYKNGKGHTRSVHSLVADAFLQDRSETVNHKDGDKLNNSLNNLEWCSQKENCIHRSQILKKGRGERQHLSKLKEKEVRMIKACLELGASIRGLARDYNVSAPTIHSIKTGETWSWVD